MKPFLNENFLLENATAQRLYHDYAAAMPIIDYHCHLSPEDIARDRQFEHLTAIWLDGDHYKWRAMRANGTDERYITGGAPPRERHQKWGDTVPYTLRNPLFHWTHLELQRYFGIATLLNGQTADAIYDEATAQLRTPAFRTRQLLARMRVEVVGTTDDPADDLAFHQQLAADDTAGVRMLPTFRPDKAMAPEDPAMYNAYLERLGTSADLEIRTYDDLKTALERRHTFFHRVGCRLSDHGLERIPALPASEAQARQAFEQVRSGQPLDAAQTDALRGDLLLFVARLNHARDWTQQLHLGAIRNQNSRMCRTLGPDTGYDSIGDFAQAYALGRLLDALDADDQLARTILYNLHPADNEVFATMAGNFQAGPTPGKIQFGSGWWFNDQKEGMERQLNALSLLGVLGRFVGMLTDSRSFLSYPRHEYFRRILCNLIGRDVENGELPHDLDWLGQTVQNICYYNARAYFRFHEVPVGTAPLHT